MEKPNKLGIPAADTVLSITALARDAEQTAAPTAVDDNCVHCEVSNTVNDTRGMTQEAVCACEVSNCNCVHCEVSNTVDVRKEGEAAEGNCVNAVRNYSLGGNEAKVQECRARIDNK